MATPYDPHGNVSYPPQPRPQGNGLAVAGMVVGILSLVLFWLWFLGGVLGVLGIVFGAIGMGKARRVGSGRGMALAGVICGAIGIVLSIAFIVFVVSAARRGLDRALESASSSLTQLEVDRMAEELYPRWSLATGKDCPADLREMEAESGAARSKLIDPWGSPFRFQCGGLPNGVKFGVYSLGPDREEGTPDDIRSWSTTRWDDVKP